MPVLPVACVAAAAVISLYAVRGLRRTISACDAVAACRSRSTTSTLLVLPLVFTLSLRRCHGTICLWCALRLRCSTRHTHKHTYATVHNVDLLPRCHAAVRRALVVRPGQGKATIDWLHVVRFLPAPQFRIAFSWVHTLRTLCGTPLATTTHIAIINNDRRRTY